MELPVIVNGADSRVLYVARSMIESWYVVLVVYPKDAQSLVLSPCNRYSVFVFCFLASELEMVLAAGLEFGGSIRRTVPQCPEPRYIFKQ